jgi:ferredoxin
MTPQTGWRVEVTEDCVSAAHCVSWAPDLFELDDDGFSTPIHDQVGANRTDDLLQAVEDCPASAIKIVMVPPEETLTGL